MTRCYDWKPGSAPKRGLTSLPGTFALALNLSFVRYNYRNTNIAWRYW